MRLLVIMFTLCVAGIVNAEEPAYSFIRCEGLRTVKYYTMKDVISDAMPGSGVMIVEGLKVSRETCKSFTTTIEATNKCSISFPDSEYDNLVASERSAILCGPGSEFTPVHRIVKP